MVQFNTIPGNLRVPLFYAEINSAQTPYSSNARLLLVGQMDTAVGTATPEEPVRIFSGHQGMFGENSMLTAMYEKARLNAQFQEIWALPLADDGAGVKATGSLLARVATTARAAAVADITIAGGAPDTLDGLTLAAGDLILLTAQTAGAENGLYEVTTLGTGADGTWTRHTSMDTDPEAHPNKTFYISEGDANASTSWEITNAAAITLGVTAITMAQTANLVRPVNQNTSISIYFAGVRVRTVALTTDTAQTLAARLAAAINAEGDPLPFEAQVGSTFGTAAVAGVDDHQIVLQARHAGEQGNTIRMEVNYFGDEGPTSGYVFDITQFSGGSGDPDITNALANLGTDEFDWIASPYSDAVNVGAAGLMLNFVSGRWGPLEQLYGHYVSVRSDTSANLAAYGDGLNDPHVSIMGVYNFLSPTWEVAAALGAVAAAHLQSAPEVSRPLQSLDLLGIYGPKSVVDRFDVATRQSLYYDGISGYHVEKDGTVSIDRFITTYQLNEWGSPDASWLDVNTLAQTMYGIRHIKAKLTGTYPRAALLDENPFGLQGVATPDDVRQTIIHGYRELIADGVFENENEFEQALIVERNSTDPNRLDIYFPADHVNQLRILAMNYTSFLQYSSV